MGVGRSLPPVSHDSTGDRHPPPDRQRGTVHASPWEYRRCFAREPAADLVILNGAEPETLVKRADKALYEAKAAGRDCFSVG